MLLLIKEETRRTGWRQYMVPTHLHLVQCSGVPHDLLDWYYRAMA